MASLKRVDFLAGILFLVIALYAGFLSYNLEIGTLSSPEAGFLPLLVSILLFRIPSLPPHASQKEGRNERPSR